MHSYLKLIETTCSIFELEWTFWVLGDQQSNQTSRNINALSKTFQKKRSKVPNILGWGSYLSSDNLYLIIWKSLGHKSPNFCQWGWFFSMVKYGLTLREEPLTEGGNARHRFACPLLKRPKIPSGINLGGSRVGVEGRSESVAYRARRWANTQLITFFLCLSTNSFIIIRFLRCFNNQGAVFFCCGI